MDGSESAARCLTAGEKAAVIMSQNRFYAAAMMATFASLLEFTSSPVDNIALAGIPDFFFRAPMSDMVELYTRPSLFGQEWRQPAAHTSAWEILAWVVGVLAVFFGLYKIKAGSPIKRLTGRVSK